MPEQSLYQKQEQRQEQTIAPQQIQSLEILIAQTTELQAKIDKELEENPLLEELPPADNADIEENANALKKKEDDTDSEPDKSSINDELVLASDSEQDIFENSYIHRNSVADEPFENFNDADDYNAEMQEAGLSFATFSDTNQNNPDTEEKRKFLMDSITVKPSLQEQLLQQLHFSNLSESEMKIAELIIGSIDERGFLRSHPADLATKEQVETEQVEKLIKYIQENFDPPGICARDLKECFMLQLKAKGMEKSKVAYLVKHHLDDLAKNKKPIIVKKMKISYEELEALISQIRKLNPSPASELSYSLPSTVIPDVFIEKKDDSFIARTNKDWMPRLRISQKYLKILDDPLAPQETKNWIKEKLNRARNVIRSLAQRETTIKRIADVIIDEQFDFLDRGIELLKPLTMQKVAEKIGVHETTVSRAISGKYVQTPRGLFEMKFFFSTGYKSENGEEMSSKSVMEKIGEMVENEDPKKPLSDQEISDILKKQGLNVARRTVAKYREALGIQSSHLRRQHN